MSKLIFDFMRSILLTLYSLYLGIQIILTRNLRRLSRCWLVCVDYDHKGPFIYLGEERVYLAMYEARPLEGIRIRDKFFTASHTKKQVEVDDSAF
jgi:hypothetical protein